MTKTKVVHAVFDGKVLKPEGSVDLEVGTRYLLTIERTIETKAPREEPPYPLTQILELATDMRVDDLSTRHDWYAHRRRDDETSGI
jgi:predicted DNA-binding antitoxin AbrB/MazE fold protein